jgi:general L-amino acid transport system substrate-binding protein
MINSLIHRLTKPSTFVKTHALPLFCARSVLTVAALGTVSNVAYAIDSVTLENVQNRGRVICGVNTNLPGFSSANSLGEYSGLDVDLCRAISAAVFGDSEKTEFVPVSATERFDALGSNRFDVLTRNTTWTLDRNANHGDYAGVNYYDGQGFMVWKSSGVRSALELDRVSLCVSRGTTTELNAADYFSINKMRYTPLYFDDSSTAVEAYRNKQCEALTTDRSGLAATRISQDNPDAHRILSEIISKEPLGPLVRANDSGWENVVRWSLNCMINAEELGITQSNIDTINASDFPAAQRLAGLVGNFGTKLGLSNSWCADIIRQVGNYGESYERHVGEASPLGLKRGVNDLWTNGGLIYAPPIR